MSLTSRSARTPQCGPLMLPLVVQQVAALAESFQIAPPAVVRVMVEMRGSLDDLGRGQRGMGRAYKPAGQEAPFPARHARPCGLHPTSDHRRDGRPRGHADGRTARSPDAASALSGTPKRRRSAWSIASSIPAVQAFARSACIMQRLGLVVCRQAGFANRASTD
jgi:hypothetical protein